MFKFPPCEITSFDPVIHRPDLFPRFFFKWTRFKSVHIEKMCACRDIYVAYPNIYVAYPNIMLHTQISCCIPKYLLHIEIWLLKQIHNHSLRYVIFVYVVKHLLCVFNNIFVDLTLFLCSYHYICAYNIIFVQLSLFLRI